jgi:bcr-type benzoyl-CoA reductase subunit C
MSMKMKKFSELKKILDDPFRYARKWKSEYMKRVIGVFLPDVPEELIHASGSFPFALLGNKKVPAAAGSIPSFACSLITTAFNQASLGDLDFLDGMVIPYFCDSSRALFHIWERNFPGHFSDLIRLPKKLEGQGTKTYLVNELKRFKKRLEKAFGLSISDAGLWRSISIFNENRRYLRRIETLRAQDPNRLSNFDFFSLVKSSMQMPKEESNKLLKEVLILMESSSQPSTSPANTRVFISGQLAEPLELFQWMDEVGILVVDDDLAVGSRYFSYIVDGEADPLLALADSYFRRVPSALVRGGEDRLSYILRRFRENGLNGVIFIHLKFCEPLIYDYPDLKKGLDREGIPNLLIETELQSLAVGQIKTRLQAFAEILGGQG